MFDGIRESLSSMLGSEGLRIFTTNARLGLTSLLFFLFYGGSLLWLVDRGRKGHKIPKIRRIAGLDAIDEAIGRATEMGRPVLFSPGISEFVPGTFAAFAVMGHVAKLIAKFDSRLIVCNRNINVYPVTQSIVRQAYLEVGKPDAYRDEDVRFLTADQFGYAAGVVGVMNRENVAAMLLIGQFYAESLIFAEAGNNAGAIQVAGTDSVAQMPFFIVACDYCLIGEEIFAAGAYLSQDKVRVATMVAQDWGKQLVVALILLGVLTSTYASIVSDSTHLIDQLLRLY